MKQTGVPFGEIAAVPDWMSIRAPVKRPAHATWTEAVERTLDQLGVLPMRD